MYSTPMDYNGWQILWTGWKPVQGDDSLMGQWLAQKGKVRIVSCVPGTVFIDKDDTDFPKVENKWINAMTPLGKALNAWEAGLDRLHEYCNKYDLEHPE